MISFACFSPHPPILLPAVGNLKDQAKVKKTIESLELLQKKLLKAKPDEIIISSPHPDWGVEVPLYFLAPNFKDKITTYLIGNEPPDYFFDEGKRACVKLLPDKKYALIASGDLSHRLIADGPYGFHPHGPEFDKKLIDCLKNKDIKSLLALDEEFPEAADCGLRSFAFILGILEGSGLKWQPEILSYEGPFGVGYLVASLI